MIMLSVNLIELLTYRILDNTDQLFIASKLTYLNFALLICLKLLIFYYFAIFVDNLFQLQ